DRNTDTKYAPNTLGEMMVEVLIAVGIFMLLVFVAVGGELVQWYVLFIIGASMVGVGLSAGVVVGIGSPLAQSRALAPTGILGPRWWWRPTSYNDHLPSASRPTVMWWFYAGVTSMVVVLVGCALILTGIMIMRNV
ncbi:MAG: hypothetical protein V3T60_05510, partial [Candidatus Binatia bacterium]